MGSLESYKISALNEPRLNALSLLCLTNKENFERRRKQILYKALEIPYKEGKHTALRALESLTKSCLVYGLSPKTADTQSSIIGEKLIKGEITPYEAVGAVKDLCPYLSAPQMRGLWAKISVITGLEHLGSNNITVNWDQALTDKAILPKLTNLERTLEEAKHSQETQLEKYVRLKKSKRLPIAQDAIESLTNKPKFIENHPHLRSSEGKNTNWSEVVSSLNPADAGLLRGMLESSKDNILKKEITIQTLWPNCSFPEAENRRLTKLLDFLGNRPTGRLARYYRIFLNEENGWLDTPKNIPTPTPTKATIKEIERANKTISVLEAPNKNWDKQEDWAHKIQLASQLKKIPDTKAQEIYKKSLEEIKLKAQTYMQPSIIKSIVASIHKQEEVTTMRDTLKLAFSKSKLLRRTIADIALNNPFSNELRGIGSALLRKCNPIEVKDDALLQSLKVKPRKGLKEHLVMKILPKILEPNKYLENLSNHELSETTTIKQMIKKELSLSSNSKTSETLQCLLSNKEFPLEKRYSKSQLDALHICSWWGNPQEVQALIEEKKKRNLTISPRDNTQRSPLHLSKPDATKLLLEAGASPKASDTLNISAMSANPYKESQNIMENWLKKKKIIEHISTSPTGLEI